jgi:hypothetical protein
VQRLSGGAGLPTGAGVCWQGVCGEFARRSWAGHPVGMLSFVAKEPGAEVPEPPPDLPPLEPEGSPEEEPEPDEMPEPPREPEEEPVPA